jgi:hypothetical protein
MDSPPLPPFRFARNVLSITIAAAWLAFSAFGQPSVSTATSPAQRQPVLVELFTSEGCSDCPPADALLAQLDAAQFIPGAQAIVLSEHVTYWNHLGWIDPFSLVEVTARQEQYQARFALDSTYTPQMVVDGAAQFVGSDVAALTRAVSQAAATPKPVLAIQNARWADGSITFSVRGPSDSSARLVAVLAADATESEVSRGENAGRILHHVDVARALRDFGSNAADGRSLRLSGADLFRRNERPRPLRLVVFMADHKTGHVLAVAEQTLNP